MLTYDLSRAEGEFLYDKLYRSIRGDIVSGRLKAGEKLPSKRALSQHLEISVITVENAYAQLMAEGYIYSVAKSGFFVSQLHELPQAQEKPPSALFSEEKSEYFMDFSSNSISAEHFPFSVWLRIMRGTILDRDKGLLGTTGYNGAAALRGAVSDFLYRFRGMSVGPEQIIIGAGTEYFYNLLIQLLGRDKTYAVEDPGHTKIWRVYDLNGVGTKFIGLDGQGLSSRELAGSGADIVHISPSHHYPTGIVMPIGRRRELLRWAAQAPGRYIIEDDYDSEFRFSGKPIPSLMSIDEGENVIYMNTFSKTIAPSMRISYMILPPHLLEIYRERMSFYTCTVPSLEQYTLAGFISGGYFEKHIRRMKNLYRIKRNTVIDAILESGLGQYAKIMEEDAGLHFLLRIDSEITGGSLTELARSVGIRVACLSDYFHDRDKGYENILVINYSGIDMEKLPEAMERLVGVFIGHG